MTQSTSSGDEDGPITCTGTSEIFGGKPSRSPAEEARAIGGTRQSNRPRPTARHGADSLQKAGPSIGTHQDDRPRPTVRRAAELAGLGDDRGSDIEHLAFGKKPRVARRLPVEGVRQLAELTSLEPSPPACDPPAYLRQQQSAGKVGSKAIARARLRQAFLRFFEVGGLCEEALRDAEEAWVANRTGVRSLPEEQTSEVLNASSSRASPKMRR